MKILSTRTMYILFGHQKKTTQWLTDSLMYLSTFLFLKANPKQMYNKRCTYSIDHFDRAGHLIGYLPLRLESAILRYLCDFIWTHCCIPCLFTWIKNNVCDMGVVRCKQTRFSLRAICRPGTSTAVIYRPFSSELKLSLVRRRRRLVKMVGSFLRGPWGYFRTSDMTFVIGIFDHYCLGA